MKVFISADIEGIAGVTSKDESDPENTKHYRQSQELMTREVVAACEGALAAGATELWVRDAHWNGRNILIERLPEQARLIRGWSMHPYMMVQGLDSSFTAAAFVGYHSRAGSGANPLAHTLSSSTFAEIRVNGKPVSEFRIYSQAAALEKVPTVFVAGDRGLCDEVRTFDERIKTVTTMEGFGASNMSIHPQAAASQIREGVRQGVLRAPEIRADLKSPQGPFEVEITYKLATEAYRRSFYPGARLKSDHVIALRCEEYFDVLRLFVFAMTF